MKTKRKYTKLTDDNIRSINNLHKILDEQIGAAQEEKQRILKKYDISTTQFYNRKKKL